MRQLCLRHLLKVHGDKSPGYPLNLDYTNNHAAMESEFVGILNSCIARLHMWLTIDETILAEEIDSYWLLENGYMDPSTIFIKDEPHPERKLVDGKYRCITPVSLVDQVVEACLFSEMSTANKESLFASGSAVGIGFHPDGVRDYINYVKSMEKKYGPATEDDVSGFDSLHTPQVYEASAEYDRLIFRIKGVAENWWKAHRVWSKLKPYSIVVIGDVLYVRTDEGMMDSGSRDTSRRNTTFRRLYGFYIAVLMDIVQNFDVLPNGDDANSWGIPENHLETYRKTAASIGITLRDLRYANDGKINFCSHLYDFNRTDGAVLTSWPKAVYKMLTKKVLEPYDVRQVLEEMRCNTQYPVLSQFVQKVAPLVD